MKILRYSLFVLVFLSRGILSSIILLITFYGCKDNKFSKEQSVWHELFSLMRIKVRREPKKMKSLI